MSIPTTAKYESGASMRSAFSWTFPGAPIRINIPLGLISRLRAELDQHENLANSTPGAEVGGVLLGHQKTPTTLEIDDYVWLSSEERPGSRYHLDPPELERLRSVYTAREENAGRQSLAVGYFRTQAEDNLHLRDEEIGFVGKHFRDPTNVVLLIRTSPQPYTAGFFFWMKEGVLAPFSFMDFPFDAELLRLEGRVTQPAEEGETTLPLPATTDKDAAALVESASTSGEEPISAPAEGVRIGLRLRSHLERPSARHSISTAAGGQLKQTEPAETTPLRTAATSKKTPARVSRRMLVAAGEVFAVLALAGLSAFLLRDHGLSGPRQKAPATVAAFPLQLEVEAQGNGLNVRWNPQSAPATQAREGHLVILEGDQRPQIIPLNPQQLTSGHVYYRSSAERLQFQLEIVDNSGRVSREYVWALSSKPSPVVTPVAPPQAGNGQSPARKVESIPIPSTDADALRLAKAMEALLSRQPAPRVFTAPRSSSGLAGQVPAIVLDQPPVIPSNSVLPPAAGLPTTLNNLRASNLPAPPVNEPPVTKQIRIGGNLQAANLIKRVTPLYPEMARSARIQGTVRFTALIGKDGTVRNLQLISGNPMLNQAATDAVKQWIYRPTLLNGDPVEVITQVDINFTLNR